MVQTLRYYSNIILTNNKVSLFSILPENINNRDHAARGSYNWLWPSAVALTGGSSLPATASAALSYSRLFMNLEYSRSISYENNII